MSTENESKNPIAPSWWQVAGILLLVGAIFGGPFVIQGNSLAQAFFSVLTTAASTGIGVWGSWRYAQNTDRDRLTRYGLQAWRNIHALDVKIRQQLIRGQADEGVLEGWLLDVDQAKWAWQDLLREVFELHERLRLESEEVATSFRERIEQASSEPERARLEDERRLAIAKIARRAPLPIAEPSTVECPSCSETLEVRLGGNSGDTAWPTCEHCGAKFPVHRKANGEAVPNPAAMRVPVRRAPVERACPLCGEANTFIVPVNMEVQFTKHCSACSTPIQCDGSAENLRVIAEAQVE